MAVKKTESKKAEPKKAIAKKTITVKKETPKVEVVKKTIAPKVIVETKNLQTENATCTTSCKIKGKHICKIIMGILIIINLIISIMCLVTINRQEKMMIMENGGKENHTLLQEIYNTPEFQQASSIGIYQLMDRVTQTLNENQPQTEQPIQ